MRSAAAFAAGIAIAFVGAICGLGGGLFAVPLLHYAFKLPLRTAVATSLCLVAANAVSSTVSEIAHPGGAFSWQIVLPLIGGALVGAQFGYLASRRLPEALTKAIFAFVMCVAAIRIILSSVDDAEIVNALAPFGVSRSLGIVSIGFLAGIASPLLGIGGGLVVVPGVLLFVPEVGMEGARAASLGVAVVTSLRSIQLYFQEGIVDKSLSPWIVLGAILGAVGGVQVVHVPGVPAIARVVLVVILFVTAVRFVLDVARRPTR